MPPRQQYGIRIDPVAREQLRATLLHKLGPGYVLESFPSLYKRTLDGLRGVFTESELRLILNALNGLFLTPGLAGQHLGLSVADAMQLDNLAIKHGVQAKKLNAKIADLKPFEAAVMEIWAIGFWGTPETTPDEYCKNLL
jgi:hypothetical protein